MLHLALLLLLLSICWRTGCTPAYAAHTLLRFGAGTCNKHLVSLCRTPSRTCSVAAMLSSQLLKSFPCTCQQQHQKQHMRQVRLPRCPFTRLRHNLSGCMCSIITLLSDLVPPALFCPTWATATKASSVPGGPNALIKEPFCINLKWKCQASGAAMAGVLSRRAAACFESTSQVQQLLGAYNVRILATLRLYHTI